MNFLVMVAMPTELKSIDENLGLVSADISELDFPIWKLKTGEQNIFFVLSGVGPIVCSHRLTRILSEVEISHVVLLGLAGSLNENVKPGDVVIPKRIAQHDAICTYSNKQTEQMRIGRTHLSDKNFPEAELYISSSDNFTEELYNYIKLDTENAKSKIHLTDMLSGSEFVGDYNRKIDLNNRFKSAVSVDMESISVAYICELYKVEFAVVKTIADGFSNESVDDYMEFINTSNKRCEFSIVNELRIRYGKK